MLTEKEIKKRINDIAKNQNNFKDKNKNEVCKKGDLIALIMMQLLKIKILKEAKVKILK